MIYLDHNATTPLDPAARDAMLPYLERHFGNPSSIHGAGRQARAAIDDARERVAALFGARPHEIVFTGGGTESDNLAVIGLARAMAAKGRHIVCATTEHHAVLHAFEYLQKREAFSVTWLPVDGFGLVDPVALDAAFRPDTTLVSVMSANNETGVLQPLQAIAAACRARGVLFHSDMVQSFGKTPLPRALPDAVSIAAHKFYGPKGAGVLYLRSGLPIQKIQFGGFHENERRPGTENVACIAGMAVAAENAVAGMEREQERERVLRDRLWAGIAASLPNAVLNGHPELRLANTLNVSFPGFDAEDLLISLDLEGVCASSGSACMVGSILPSHVLLAMGVAPPLARSTIRFSLGKQTTAREIDEALEILSRVLSRLSAAVA